jgi:hypothetical protein
MPTSLRLTLATVLVALSGCDEPAPKKAAPQPPAAKPRPILNERTQDIRDTQKEIQKGGAVPAPPRVVAKDPFTLAGNVYVSAIGQTSIGQIKQAVELYRANNDGEYPKTHQEFMENVIKPNNIRLPTLPYYQEYSYDVATHQLNIIEYPAKKEAGQGR